MTEPQYDPDMMLNFLSSLDPETIPESQKEEVRQMLGGVSKADHIKGMVERGVDPDVAADKADEFIKRLNEITG